MKERSESRNLLWALGILDLGWRIYARQEEYAQ